MTGLYAFLALFFIFSMIGLFCFSKIPSVELLYISAALFISLLMLVFVLQDATKEPTWKEVAVPVGSQYTHCWESYRSMYSNIVVCE